MREAAARRLALLPLAALLIFVAGLALRPMAESDLFFRIAAGREILSERGLPGRNLFSFTYPDAPDLDTAWLFEVGAAVGYRHGGFPVLVIAKTIVLCGTFAAAYWLCRRRGAGPATSALVLAAAALVGRERFVERPHVFSFAGEIATLIAIDLLAGVEGRRALAVGAALLAVVLLWANLHAGVFVGPLMLGAAALAAVPAGGRRARTLALLAVAAALATLLTPVGFGLVRYLGLHLRIPAVHPVDEFRPPTWVSDAPLLGYALAVGVAAAIVARWTPLPRRSLLAALAPVVPLGLLAARSVRFGADFALAAVPFLAWALAVLFAQALEARPRRPTWRAPLPAVATAAMLLGFTVAPRVTDAAAYRDGIGLDRRELPLAAIAFVDANGLRDRMYNDFELGSYLIFEPAAGYPRHRVFVDPRLPAYPIEMHRLLGRADLTRDEWSAAMDRYGVESALCAYAGVNRRVSWWDPERWALVFRDDDARVFVRRLPRYRAFIAAREIPATFSFTPEAGNETVPIARPPVGSPVPGCEWHRRLGDLLFEIDGAPSDRARAAYGRALAVRDCLRPLDEARLCAFLAATRLEAGGFAEALSLLDRALGHGDRELSTFTNRALALEALGRPAEAALAWGDVASRAGETPLGARARARRARLLELRSRD